MGRKIENVVTVRVTEQDGSWYEFEGVGSADVVDTFVPADPDTNTPQRPVRYLSLILSMASPK